MDIKLFIENVQVYFHTKKNKAVKQWLLEYKIKTGITKYELFGYYSALANVSWQHALSVYVCVCKQLDRRNTGTLGLSHIRTSGGCTETSSVCTCGHSCRETPLLLHLCFLEEFLLKQNNILMIWKYNKKKSPNRKNGPTAIHFSVVQCSLLYFHHRNRKKERNEN